MRWLLTMAVVVGLLTAKVTLAGTFFKYGVGVFGSAEYGRTETKNFSVGYEEEWFGPLISQYELGVFTDSAGDVGRHSSGYGNISTGVQANPGYLVVRSMWGVGAITSPDSMLGGWFEFNQDFLLGVKDDKGNMIGLDYKHISSAGIYNPNQGRDFIMIHVEIPW